MLCSPFAASPPFFRLFLLPIHNSQQVNVQQIMPDHVDYIMRLEPLVDDKTTILSGPSDLQLFNQCASLQVLSVPNVFSLPSLPHLHCMNTIKTHKRQQTLQDWINLFVLVFTFFSCLACVAMLDRRGRARNNEDPQKTC